MTNPASDSQMNQNLVDPDFPDISAKAPETTSETLVRATPDTLNQDDRLKVELLAEQLSVEKGVRQMGEVTFSKRVVEEEVQVPVTLRREEVTMTRREVSVPVDGDSRLSDEGAEAFTEQTIVIRLYEEVPQITKITRVSGEVEISKRIVTREKNLIETVRHEEIDVSSPENIIVSDPDKMV